MKGDLHLDILFDWEAAGNPFFYKIYHNIYKTLRLQKGLKVTHIQPDYSDGACMSCPGGRSNFQIINPLNNKSILMSFWDRGMDVFQAGLGWEKYDIKQYIGGIGMHKTSRQIMEDYGIRHEPFQYPLGVAGSDEMIDIAKAKNLPKKEKAVFIGQIYGTREELVNHFSKTGFIDVFDPSAGFVGQSYYDKMSEYGLIISLNGNGEFCMRDLEGFGLGVPVVRSMLKTRFHNQLVPNVHYLVGSAACPDAWHSYKTMDIKNVAESFIRTIEGAFYDPNKLNYVGNMGEIYYRNYANPAYISNLFIDLIDINELI